MTNRTRKPYRKKPLADRFWAKVNKDGPVVRPELGPCWIWTGASVRGYGVFRRVGGPKGQNVMAHRMAFEIEHGEPPADNVLHRCDNPPCCRPSHLQNGTQQDNILDMVAKGRRSPNSVQRGAKHYRSILTEEDVVRLRTGGFGDQTDLQVAEHLGVARSVVSAAASGRSWAHLNERVPPRSDPRAARPVAP